MKLHEECDAFAYSLSHMDTINTLMWSTDHIEPSEFSAMQTDLCSMSFVFYKLEVDL